MCVYHLSSTPSLKPQLPRLPSLTVQASWSCSSYQLATAPKPGTSAARSRRRSPLSTAPSSCCARALKDSTRDSRPARPTTGARNGKPNSREIWGKCGKMWENVEKMLEHVEKMVKIWRKTRENMGENVEHVGKSGRKTGNVERIYGKDVEKTWKLLGKRWGNRGETQEKNGVAVYELTFNRVGQDSRHPPGPRQIVLSK